MAEAGKQKNRKKGSNKTSKSLSFGEELGWGYTNQTYLQERARGKRSSMSSGGVKSKDWGVRGGVSEGGVKVKGMTRIIEKKQTQTLARQRHVLKGEGRRSGERVKGGLQKREGGGCRLREATNGGGQRKLHATTKKKGTARRTERGAELQKEEKRRMSERKSSAMKRLDDDERAE